MATAAKLYELDGTLLEACSCAGPCPCWVSDDPDGGSCDAFNTYHIDHGQLSGIDVSGLSLIGLVQIPGNVLAGNWREVLYIDDKATLEQREALPAAFTGRLLRPLAELATLIGDQVAVQYAPIEHKIVNGSDTLHVDDQIMATIEPYRDREGRPTMLQNTLFS